MIKLTSFNLEKIQLEGKHYGLVQNMSLDNKVKLYIEKDFFDWLKKYQAISDDEIEIGKMYAIEKDKKEYGVIGSKGINEDGYLELVYAIKKNMRDRGYGTKVLEEITPYLLEQVKNILQDIEEIKFVTMTTSDVCRHPLVQKIIDAYEKI